MVGTDYRPEPERQQGLKWQIAQGTEPSVTFREIYVMHHEGGRVVMMEIPPAPVGIPIAWQGHFYARAGESLVSLGLDKLDTIRGQSVATDWSAVTVPEVTLDDLDPSALNHARQAFAKRYHHLFTVEDVIRWPLDVFTDRTKLSRRGQVTRAGLLLVGKPEAAGFLTPHPAQLTWSLSEPERAYEHFGPPFLLNSTRLYDRIRNVQIRLIRPGTLLTVEVPKYDARMVLEGLHNAIAHQDPLRGGRILVEEYLDRIVITNEGSFFVGAPVEYATRGAPPIRYRNTMLAQAMADLGMIDTLGYGIHDMYARQQRRYLPMPDYDLTKSTQVRLTIYGSVISEAYTDQLMARPDLPLTDVLALDQVQKGLPIPAAMTQRLRQAGLIAGRKPNLYVAPMLDAGDENAHRTIPSHTVEEDRRLHMILSHLEAAGPARRRDLDELLAGEFSDDLDSDKRSLRITNLLTRLRRSGRIRNTGTKANPLWELSPRGGES